MKDYLHLLIVKIVIVAYIFVLEIALLKWREHMRSVKKDSIVLEELVIVEIHSTWQTSIHELLIPINLSKSLEQS